MRRGVLEIMLDLCDFTPCDFFGTQLPHKSRSTCSLYISRVDLRVSPRMRLIFQTENIDTFPGVMSPRGTNVLCIYCIFATRRLERILTQTDCIWIHRHKYSSHQCAFAGRRFILHCSNFPGHLLAISAQI